MKRADWKPSTHAVLCEKHFIHSDYINKVEISTINGHIFNAARSTKKYLKPDAVPFVLHFSPHLVKKSLLGSLL